MGNGTVIVRSVPVVVCTPHIIQVRRAMPDRIVARWNRCRPGFGPGPSRFMGTTVLPHTVHHNRIMAWGGEHIITPPGRVVRIIARIKHMLPAVGIQDKMKFVLMLVSRAERSAVHQHVQCIRFPARPHHIMAAIWQTARQAIRQAALLPGACQVQKVLPVWKQAVPGFQELCYVYVV